MLEIRNIVLLLKYITMFKIVMIASHIISASKLNIKQCMLIALSAATMFAILDHVAPICVTPIKNNIKIKTCNNIELNKFTTSV